MSSIVPAPLRSLPFSLPARTLAVMMLLFCAGGCALRHSVDSLKEKNDALERRNFELRKQLAEARVRAAMKRGGSGGEAVAQAGAPEPSDVAAPLAPRSSGVVYSEPITQVPGSAGSTPGPAPGVPGLVAGSAAAGELMRSARGRLDAEDYEAALASFREILARYPGDALADDAQFGVGEVYFAQGKYDQAIQEYRAVAERFPFGDQVPFAFLKTGFSYLAMEKRDQALDSFRTVSQAYPGTEAATVARQQIAHMKAGS